MKVSFSKDEQYPVYGLYQNANGMEIPDDLFARYQRNIEEYDAIQSELAAIYEAKEKREKEEWERQKDLAELARLKEKYGSNSVDGK